MADPQMDAVASPVAAMFDPERAVEPWRAELAARTRVQVADFLAPDAAARLHQSLAREVPWQLAERASGQARVSPRGGYPAPGDYLALMRAAHGQAGHSYQFLYDNYFLLDARRERWDPGLYAHHVLALLNSEPLLAWMRALTGDASLRAAIAQATCYRPGHFLLAHDDHDPHADRRYAYVLNLTPDWRADWGGLLQFLGPHGEVIDTLMPRWNSLSLFKVPQPHQVSLVAPWAGHDRLAITGWFLGG